MKKYSFLSLFVVFTTSVFGQPAFKNSFAPENNFHVANLAAADFDGDVYKDLVYTNTSDKKIVILKNIGAPSGSSTQTIAVGDKAGTLPVMELGDFNNDNKVDIMAINYDKGKEDFAQLIILTASGNSFSQKSMNLPQSSYIWFSQVIDFDKDGSQDILLGNTQTLYLYKGDGTGNFSSTTLSGIPNNWSQFKSADLDLDGKNDIVTVSMDSVIVSLKNNSGGYSIHKYPFVSKVVPQGLGLGDLSGDNFPEVVVGAYFINSSEPAILEYVNDGNGGLSIPNTISGKDPALSEIDFFDYNNDNRLDLLTGVIGQGQDFQLLKNLGNNQFSDQSATNNSSVFFNSAVFVDLDNDGIQEIAALSFHKYLSLFEQVGGVFYLSKKIVLGTTAYQGDVTDLNKDGHQDIITTSPTGGTLSIIYGVDGKNFSAPIYITSNDDEIGASTSSDFNGDKFQDVIYVTGLYSMAPVLSILPSDPSGKLGEPTVIAYTSSSVLASGDFNSDGKMDIATDHGIYINDGAANFTYKSFNTGLGYIATLGIGNFNSDNFLDIFVGDGATIYISLNDGHGNFTTFTSVNINDYLLYSAKSTLLNGDKLTDLIAIKGDNTGVALLTNLGNGSFSSKVINAPANSQFFGSIDCDDINSDGLKDVVVGVSSNSPKRLFGVAIFLQDKNGNFNFSQNAGFADSPTGENAVPDFVKIVDIDGDSKKDIVCFRLNGDPIEIIINNSVAQVTGLEATATSIQVFPNPFTETVYVNLPQDTEVNSVAIADLTGCTSEVPYQIDGQRLVLNLGQVGYGMYVVRILTSNSIYSTKVIKVGSR